LEVKSPLRTKVLTKEDFDAFLQGA
jgi:hypothetical protein